MTGRRHAQPAREGMFGRGLGEAGARASRRGAAWPRWARRQGTDPPFFAGHRRLVLLCTNSLHKRIAVALQATDAALPFAFPGIRRVGRIPGAKQRLLFRRKAKAGIGRRHIERRPCDGALGGIRRFHPPAGDLDGTGPKGRSRIRQGGRRTIGTGGIDGTDGRKDIVHIRLHAAKFAADPLRAPPPPEHGAVATAAAAVPLPPGRERPAESRRRHDMLPFETPGAVQMSATAEAGWRRDDAVRGKRRAAIQGLPVIRIDLPEQQTPGHGKALQPRISPDGLRADLCRTKDCGRHQPKQQGDEQGRATGAGRTEDQMKKHV